MSNNQLRSPIDTRTCGQSAILPEEHLSASELEAWTLNTHLDKSYDLKPPSPPYSNTGGIQPYLKRQESAKDCAFVDWINFTCKCTSFNGVSDDEIVIKLSNKLSEILGFGATSQRPTGLMCYKASYILGNDWGFICIGGQNDTVLVSMTGSGCMAAKPHWEKRLLEFLPSLHQARITRIDLASDFFEGEYTPDQALKDYHAELFSLGARMPEIEQQGNWIKPSGKGRTLKIGSRKSGKMLRIYEKGLQLGKGFSDLFPQWVRVEGELHNQDREIPFEVLDCPGQYLAGLYPALHFINHKQQRIKTKKNTSKVIYDALANTTKHQFGKMLYVMREVEGSADAVLDKVSKEGIPKRLNIATMDYQNAISNLELETISEETALAIAVREGL